MNDKADINNTQSPLHVPMNIEALAVPAQGTGNSTWVDMSPDFRGIKKNAFLGQQLTTDISSNKQKKLHEPGVHLHWALPDGLCHGVCQGEDDEPALPFIPNRWLVIRFSDHSPSGQPPDFKFKSWVIESDYVYEVNETRDGKPVTFPNLNKEARFDYVGKTFAYETWSETHSEYRIDLTAMGYGNPAFAGYYPASRGILGFHDKEITALENLNVNYFVLGWYSDALKDPLHIHQSKISTQNEKQKEKLFEHLEEFLAESGWTYPGLESALAKENALRDLEVEIEEINHKLRMMEAHRPDAQKEQIELREQITHLQAQKSELTQELSNLQNTVPNRILCHGVISGIRLDKDKPYNPGIPKDEPVSIAIGNTAIEALIASFRNALNDDDLARLLETFQYDLVSELAKPNGDERVEQKIHERSFSPSTRGTRWTLVQDEATPHAAPAETKTPPIPGNIRVLLQNLNARQSKINRLKRERDAIKSELYASWYKRTLNAEVSSPIEDKLKEQIKDLSNTIADLEDKVLQRPKGDEWDRLHERLHTFLPGYTLQVLDEPRFWRPNDPVLLFTGDAFKRSNRHSEDGRFRSDGRLLCRLGGQELTALRMTIANAIKEDVQFGPNDLDTWCKPLVNTATLPFSTNISNLFREALFLTLDRQRCHSISVAAYDKNQQDLADSYPEEVKAFSDFLFYTYLEKVWREAKDSDLDNPGLRYEDPNPTGKALEFLGVFPSPLVLSEWKKTPWIPLFLYWQVNWQPLFSDEAINLDGWNLTPEGTAFDWSNKTIQSKGRQRYNGTTLLTPGAALTFSERLRQYSLSHNEPELKKFMTEVRSMNLLCQNLGGFTDQLLMRKAHIELQPLERGAGKKDPPQQSPIFEQVDDIDWLSPLTGKAFLPLRAGQLELEKLWVIDAFGQLLQLEDIALEEKNKPGSYANPLVPERLASSDGAIRFDPRLAQATRLNIFWPPANRYGNGLDQSPALKEHEEANPVCGWILPNFLDNSLMIYDSQGNALGALQAVQRKSWDSGVGGQKAEIESFHWADIPGGKDVYFGLPSERIEDPLGDTANPHLRDFVNGLLALGEGSGQAFSQLLTNIQEFPTAAGGTTFSENPNLALLIGKPLALVRASIFLELDGHAASDPDWDETKKEQRDRSGGIENLKFPIRLGDRRRWNDIWVGDDGLVGFFLEQNYKRFYPAYGLSGTSDSYCEYSHIAKLSLTEPLDLTLLMEPGRGICATTGILPRKLFTLPYGDISDTLENKQVVFFTGPVVSPRSEQKISMPPPSDIYGQWAWTHHPDVEVWREDTITDSSIQQGQFVQNEHSIQINEGWLKLITAPLSIRDFSVDGIQATSEERKLNESAVGNAINGGETPVPAQFEAPKGNKIVLRWTVVGAQEIELRQGEHVLFKTDRHPLPEQLAVRLDQDKLFSLRATDRAKQTRQKTIEIKAI